MVCFSRFSYTFKWEEREFWKQLLCKGFDGVKMNVTSSTKCNDEILSNAFDGMEIDVNNINIDIKCNDESLSNAFNTLSQSNPAIVTVNTERVWNEVLFWNMLPEVKWNELELPTDIDNIKGHLDNVVNNLYHNVSDIDPRNDIYLCEVLTKTPFKYIAYIMNELNKKIKITKLYYSPSVQTVIVRFNNDVSIELNENCVKFSCNYVLDFDDGICTGEPTQEMKTDFENWKNNKTLELFKLRLPFC